MKKVLIFIFLFIIVDIFLIFLFFRFRAQSNIDKSSFIDANDFNLDKGQILIFPADRNNGSLSFIRVSGSIKETPYISSGENYIKISINTPKGKLDTTALLGYPDNKIMFSTLKSNSDLSVNPNWEIKNLKEIFPLLVPGKGVTIQLPYESADSQKLNINSCNDLCQKNIERINRYYSNNIFLVEIIKEKKTSSKLDIGPITGLVLLEK